MTLPKKTTDPGTQKIFKKWLEKQFLTDLTEEERIYIQRSWPRYVFVLRKVEECVEKRKLPASGAGLTILDVGPHFFTTLLRERFPESVINTLGFESYGMGPAQVHKHFTFNLNDSQFPERWIKIPEHDIVVMGEVIEHLYTAPWLVLKFIKTAIKKGGFLVLSTPNAATLHKRIYCMLGSNPHEMLREEYYNPGHIREYTVKELVTIGEKAGLATEGIDRANYFIPDSRKGKLLLKLTGFVRSFREGITVVYHRE
jgi:Methyltransferase domain